MIDGLPADIVALALPIDIQKIADAGLIRQGWEKRFPYSSVISMVRATHAPLTHPALPGPPVRNRHRPRSRSLSWPS